jgi:hypothetical protein
MMNDHDSWHLATTEEINSDDGTDDENSKKTL